MYFIYSVLSEIDLLLSIAQVWLFQLKLLQLVTDQMLINLHTFIYYNRLNTAISHWVIQVVSSDTRNKVNRLILLNSLSMMISFHIDIVNILIFIFLIAVIAIIYQVYVHLYQF